VTTGAEKALAAVRAVIDFRNSQRFIAGSRQDGLKLVRQAACQSAVRHRRRFKGLNLRNSTGVGPEPELAMSFWRRVAPIS
jgi:hypothetical protein